MDAYLLDKDRNVLELIDYGAVLWSREYQGYGNFIISCGLSAELSAVLEQAYFVTVNDTKQNGGDFGIIEQYEIGESFEGGDTINIRGRMGTSLLERRVVWGTLNFKDGIKADEIVKALVSHAFIGAPQAIGTESLNTLGNRAVSGFSVAGNVSTAPVVNGAQYTGNTIGTSVLELCKEYGLGLRLDFKSTSGFIFEVFSGTDQTAKVVFSEEYDNLFDAKLTEDWMEYKNVSLVGGDGSADEDGRYFQCVKTAPPAEGLNRFECFTDAGSIEDDDLNTAQYNAALQNEGKRDLLKRTLILDAEMTDAYAYRTDYDVGDIVQVKSRLKNISKPMRVIEVTEQTDNEGIKIVPTFSDIEEGF